MDYKELIEELRKNLPEMIPYGELVCAPWPYTHQGDMVYEDPFFYEVEKAADAIAELLERAEKAEKERDAAVFDLLRAEEEAKKTFEILDDEVHPICDYSLYLSLHDSVSDIVNWQKADLWRKKAE